MGKQVTCPTSRFHKFSGEPFMILTLLNSIILFQTLVVPNGCTQLLFHDIGFSKPYTAPGRPRGAESRLQRKGLGEGLPVVQRRKGPGEVVGTPQVDAAFKLPRGKDAMVVDAPLAKQRGTICNRFFSEMDSQAHLVVLADGALSVHSICLGFSGRNFWLAQKTADLELQDFG